MSLQGHCTCPSPRGCLTNHICWALSPIPFCWIMTLYHNLITKDNCHQFSAKETETPGESCPRSQHWGGAVWVHLSLLTPSHCSVAAPYRCPSQVSFSTCGLGLISAPLWASVFTSANWSNDSCSFWFIELLNQQLHNAYAKQMQM